jgi:hypothetical protein
MRYKLLFRIIACSALSLFLVHNNFAQTGDPELAKIRLEVNEKAKPFTSQLPAIDKIELLKVGRLTADGEIDTFAATRTIEGRQAQQLATLWRGQIYNYNFSPCHVPAYAIKFYSGGQLLLYASVCWRCQNIQFLDPAPGAQGFAAQGRRGKSLLRTFAGFFARK